MSTLAVFVHGLGANEHEFWGTTPDALRNSDLVRPDTEIKFWGYETATKPRPLQRLLGPFGAGAPLESVDSLGEHLWSKLRLWFRDGRYDEVRLLGHSMGGLVVAAAVGRGLEESRSNDERLIGALSGVAFIATPLGGAGLADRAGTLFEIFGKNVHVEDLARGSASRARLVSRFIGEAVRSDRVSLTVFRASNDQVVAESEVDEPLVRSWELNYKKDVLAGNHSGCVQNLQPDDDNLRMLIHWVRGRLTAADIIELGKKGKPVSVFVSRPTMLNQRQQTFLDALYDMMRSKGLRPRTLGLTDVAQQEGGMYDVLDLLRKCHGVMVLGFSQIRVDKATFKGGTDKERDAGPCEFVTPWNHMEACMAFTHRVPLLILKEASVQSDGVFDHTCLRLTPYVTDLSPSWLEDRFRPVLEAWIEQVAERASAYV